jgi:hypothetical protein
MSVDLSQQRSVLLVRVVCWGRVKHVTRSPSTKHTAFPDLILAVVLGVMRVLFCQLFLLDDSILRW